MKVTYSVELLEATINKQVAHIERLEAALREIARQKTVDELDEEELERADFETAYNVLISRARAMLAPERDK